MDNLHLNEYEIMVLQIDKGKALCKIAYSLHL